MPDAPRVFISYSHDGEAHETRVLDLANRLREDGIDAEIDQYEDAPTEGWPAWCEERIKEADFVLLVCTEPYLRRVEGEEEAGRGLGVVWEGRIIRQLIYDAGANTQKFVPVLFDEASTEHIPTAVKGATRWVVATSEGYEGLYRQLTQQPKVKKPVLGKVKPMPPKSSRSGTVAQHAPTCLADVPPPLPPTGGAATHPEVGRIFVGRREELAALAACLLPDDANARRPVAVVGMAGVGKSYLVDRFFWENRARFPGGYHRLALDAEKPGAATDLLAMLADRLKLSAGADDAAFAAVLREPLALVHIENVDTPETAAVVGELAQRLAGCAFVASARLGTIAAGSWWGEAKLASFDEAASLEQFSQELGKAAPDADALRPLCRALGGLPLAVHLAAGYLECGETAEDFLRLLRRRGLSLEPINPADPSFRERSRSRLSAVFALSLAALERAAEARGRPPAIWHAAFRAMGYAPAAGFGESLGAAIANLEADEFGDMARGACALSLLDRLPRDDDAPAFRLHPLLAELHRAEADGNAVIARMTDWFCERLPEGGADQGRRWGEIHAEAAALLDWLPRVPPAEHRRVVKTGMRFAVTNGPFHAWLRFCEDSLARALDDEQRSEVLWMLGQVALRGGLPDRALAAAKEKRELDRLRGAESEEALAAGLIADVLELRGELDEALRIRREDLLPVWERLGDERAKAMTMGQIADLLAQHGEWGEALEIRRQNELPVYERLGEVRAKAVTMGKIADVLSVRGELDEALRIRREDELPVYERLGDLREKAVTMGKIAELLAQRGEVDAALDTYREELLPVYERLGDVRAKAVTMGKIADLRAQRGELDEAIRTYGEDVLPAYARLGDARMLVIDRWWLASHLMQRGAEGDREKAQAMLRQALEDARRMRLPQADEIDKWMHSRGLS